MLFPMTLYNGSMMSVRPSVSPLFRPLTFSFFRISSVITWPTILELHMMLPDNILHNSQSDMRSNYDPEMRSKSEIFNCYSAFNTEAMNLKVHESRQMSARMYVRFLSFSVM